ncbi:MOSC domain-containing protein [Frigidibacter sp.]|uniref:MOSC domain-containing protein n=1 Tax=Frigidibacter sp. TaxID=2586418 RepID=UPI0027370FC6|nr:MOSC domain-containing protein [Frigidibacter sp.]MDP3338823.1 MOSC domain-containing protein [Frigidibacter sp.]
MPVLKPCDVWAEIVWLGRVDDRAATLAATPLPELHATFAGVEGEEHAGLTRPSCSRVTAQYPRNTEIRNTRQFSILAQEDLDAIAAAMGLDSLDPAWVGASMVVKGIPDFSHVPPSSRLQAGSGATLVVDIENRPCTLPAKVIDAVHPGAGKLFKPAAKGKRGITAWVEREGVFRLGDRLRLHVPDQPVWAHLAEVRG